LTVAANYYAGGGLPNGRGELASYFNSREIHAPKPERLQPSENGFRGGEQLLAKPAKATPKASRPARTPSASHRLHINFESV